MSLHPLRVFEPRWWWNGSDPQPHANVQVFQRGPELRIEIGARIPFSATRIALPHSLLMPAWCNYHTHLELSHVHRPGVTGRFVDWLQTVMKSGPTTPEQVAAAVTAGLQESRAFGVTEIIDISRNTPIERPAILQTDLRVHSCGEVTGLGKRWMHGSKLHLEALDTQASAQGRDADHLVPIGSLTRKLTSGLSPHAPYSTAATWYSKCAYDAREGGMTITTHLAETPEERQFLATRTGPFADLWQNLGGLPDFELDPDGPIAFLDKHDVLRKTNLIAAHCNDVTGADLLTLADHNVTVVHCPRTHEYFNRPPFDLDRYERAGVKIRLGTDSKASAPNLDMRAEVATLAKRYPHRPLGTLVPLSLPPTFQGDLIAYPITTENPIQEIIFSETKPTHIFPAP